MDSKTAKRAVAKMDATLEYGDDKVWKLTASNGNFTSITSQQLKVMDKDELESEVDGLLAVNVDDEGFSTVAEEAATEGTGSARGRARKWPVKVIPARWPNKTEELAVILPDGTEVDGAQNSNYCYFLYDGKPKCVRKSEAGERFDGITLKLN